MIRSPRGPSPARAATSEGLGEERSANSGVRRRPLPSRPQGGVKRTPGREIHGLCVRRLASIPQFRRRGCCGMEASTTLRPPARPAATTRNSEPVMSTDPRAFLTELFNTAVAAGHPYQVLADHLPEDRSRRAIVIGAGKAAGAMAEVVEKHWQGEIQGLVVAPYRYGAQCSRIEVVEASPSGARRRRRARRPSCAGTDQRPERERPGDLPSLRRRFRTAFAACRRHRPGGQAGGEQGAAQVRRRHRRDELRAQAPLGDQGRSPGQGLLAGQRLPTRFPTFPATRPR